MKRRYFFDNIVPIVTYAVAGTTISSVTVGLIMYAVGQLAFSIKLSLAEALSFGALISATDTVSVLAIFQELRVDPKLFYLVFGESSLNDAVAIVLFGTFSKFIGNVYSSAYLPIAILDFILIFVGSTLIGILFGVLSALLFKHFDFKGCLYHEMGVYMMFAYLPFLIAAIFDLSGVVAILFTDLGLAVFALQVGYHVKFIVWALVACLAGRAAFVFPLSYLINFRRDEERKVPKNQQVMIWFSGFRGALCFALALEWPNDKRSVRQVIATTMVVVLATLFVGGGLTVPMLKYLKIKQLTVQLENSAVPVAPHTDHSTCTQPAEEIELDQNVVPIKRMKALQFDAKYWVPFFTHMHPDTGSFHGADPIQDSEEDTSKDALRPEDDDSDDGDFATINVSNSSVQH
ncbi:hypothetical protein DYB32_003800 [Aphanomyces invadans]|uniref:Cation/H+ exchanger transmembrane domain-containing protein n=1 Tax=Aphanomyces invadans TaxID=157072 RepID=A0A3R6VZA4_9STRA|nr:hypothetical protein DYB32_003800 [Aphanomyces invadans]